MELRVLHVVTVSFSLPYFVGDQFDFFRNKGVKFYVASSLSTHLNQYSQEKKFEIITIDIKRKIDLWGDIIAILKLYKAIKKNRIDVVVGHTPKGGLIAMLAAFLARNKRRVYFRHGLVYQTATGFNRSILKFIERVTGFFAQKVVCVSKSIEEISKKDKLNDNRKNLVLGRGTCNGVNLSRFSRNSVSAVHLNEIRVKLGLHPGDYVVGFVGRLVNDKGIPELIKAWTLIQKTQPLKLLLIGPLEERDGLSNEIQHTIFNDNSIICTGLIEDVRDYYALMDMFILPSHREGFPTVILEASAMELPVLTTKVTGCIDSIVENETGIFCTHQPIDIANKISFLLKNRERAEEMGRKGKEFISKNYDEKVIWSEIETKIIQL
ncbi:hypothetical protein GCM10027051_32690 [Niabella terrae]